jgi:hypothetical protein
MHAIGSKDLKIGSTLATKKKGEIDVQLRPNKSDH